MQSERKESIKAELKRTFSFDDEKQLKLIFVSDIHLSHDNIEKLSETIKNK